MEAVNVKLFSNAFRYNHLFFLVSSGKGEGIQLRGGCVFRVGFCSLTDRVMMAHKGDLQLNVDSKP
jgi:hypothetical protein